MPDPTLTNYGVFTISGTELKTAVDAITGMQPVISGSALYLIPAGLGQINLIAINY